MTNEEKILRKTYGANYESSVSLMNTSQLSKGRFSPLRKRSPGTAMGKRVTLMEDPYNTPMVTRNAYVDIYQKVSNMASTGKLNREKAIQRRAELSKDKEKQIEALRKKEDKTLKEKAKKEKDQREEREHMLKKNHEKFG